MIESTEQRNYSLVVSEDKLLAVLQAYAPVDVDEDELLRYLEQEAKVVSVDRAAVRDFLKQCSESAGEVSTPVARGTGAKHGTDGEVKWAIDLERSEGPADNERVDWYERSDLVSVDADALLATILPPTKGQSGVDVFGQPIHANDGSAAALNPGANVTVSKDGMKLRAAQGGMVIVKGKSVNIEPVYRVNDVDFDTGSIDFKGQVAVAGNVLDLFTVKAAEDITIKGCVEGAVLESQGDVVIKGGVAGKERCVITAQGSLTAHYLNYCTAKCKGDVLVNLEVLHAYIQAGGALTVKQKGIIGGHISVCRRLETKTLGSETGIRTEIAVGQDPLDRPRLEVLRAKEKTLSAQVKNLASEVNQWSRMKSRLPEAKREELARLQEEKNAQEAELGQVREQLRALMDKIRELQVRASVLVKDTLYPGVIFEMGGVKKAVTERLEGPLEVKFDLAKKQILFLSTREKPK